MGQLKKKLLYIGLSASAYISPSLMILSLFTNYWLHSSETVVVPTAKDRPTTTTTTTTVSGLFFGNINVTRLMTTKNTTIKQYYPLDHMEALYGLWEMCKITDTSRRKHCETIKHFRGGSDSEVRLTDILKRQIGICIIPILTALVLMASSVILHTYACLRNKMPHLFLISGCIFIFAGLASLTGLIVFIAAVNGAVDSQLTASQMSEEPPFVYQYGLSFFCAILSFLMQEFNGICNVYWYVGHYSKYRFEQQNQLAKQIEINSVRSSNATQKIKIINSNENLNNNLINKRSSANTPKIGFDVCLLNQKENNNESSNKNVNNNIKQEVYLDSKNNKFDIETIKNCSTSNVSNFEQLNQNKDLKKQLQDVSTSVSDINNKSLLLNTNTNTFGNKKLKNFHKICQPASSTNDSPSIKFIIDERLTAPLSLNILPVSYSNKLKTTLVNPKNVVLNEDDFNTTTSMSFTTSQSTTPQLYSATSTSQEEDEESTPNMTITSSSSTSTDSTLSPVDETSMTESACQMNTTDDNISKNNPEIMLINKIIKPSNDSYTKFDPFEINQKQNLNQFSSYIRGANPIDLENDQDDLKAKFYKIPLKSNKDSTLNNNTTINNNSNNSTLIKENNQNRINNLKLINTTNPNYSKSFDDHYNNVISNDKLKKQQFNNLSKNISCTFSNDLISYLCDKSLSENNSNNNNSKDTLRAALKKHEQNQIYQSYLFEKYLKKQQKKENELEYLKGLLIKNATDVHKYSSHLSPLTPPPPTSASNSTLQNSPSNILMQKMFSNDSNSNQNQNNIPVLVKRQQSHHYINPVKLNMNDAMVHNNNNNNYKSNSLRLDTNVNNIINTANKYQSKLYDYNNNNNNNNIETCFNNNLYMLNSSTQNSPTLIGLNSFTNNNNNSNVMRQKSFMIGPEEMAKYRNESNVSRMLRHRNKYRPKYQRNKSSDYQPITRYIIDNNSNEKYNYEDDDDLIDSRVTAFNSNTIKRLLNGDADTNGINKETNDQNNFKFMTINPSRSNFGISNETNAQRLRRNFKRTTSV